MHRDRNFIIPSAIAAAYGLMSSFAMFFLPVYFKEDLGFSGAQIGLLFGAYGVTALAAVFPSGLSTDYVTPRRVLLVSAVLTVFAAIGVASFETFAAVLGAFVLFGMSGNSTKVATEAFLYKTHSLDKSGETFGLYQGIRMVGFAITTVFGGAILMRIGFPSTILVFASVMLLVAAATFALPDIPVTWNKLSLYAGDFKNKRVLAFAVWLFLFTSHWGAESTSYGLFVHEDLGLSKMHMGWFMAGEFFVYAVVAFWFGRKHDRGMNLPRILLVGIVLSGVGHMAMTYPYVPSSLAFRLIHGVGDGLVAVAMFVGVSRLFLRERIGGNSGLVNLVIMSGVLTGSLVYGPVGERFGYGVPLFSSGLIMVGLAAFPQLWRRVGDSAG